MTYLWLTSARHTRATTTTALEPRGEPPARPGSGLGGRGRFTIVMRGRGWPKVDWPTENLVAPNKLNDYGVRTFASVSHARSLGARC